VQTTRRHILEDDKLHVHRCENLISRTRFWFNFHLIWTVWADNRD